jgi:ketosteroid isomerase-like protein
MKPSRAWVCLLSFAVALAAASSSRAAGPEDEVRLFVQGYLNAANALDIATLMRMYAPGSGTTVVRNGTITYGWDAINAQAKRSIGIAVRDSFEVSAEDMRVTPLGPQNAYVVTPLILTEETPVGPNRRHGALTLIVEKRQGKWLILHDHTTLTPNP